MCAQEEYEQWRSWHRWLDARVAEREEEKTQEEEQDEVRRLYERMRMFVERACEMAWVHAEEVRIRVEAEGELYFLRIVCLGFLPPMCDV